MGRFRRLPSLSLCLSKGIKTGTLDGGSGGDQLIGGVIQADAFRFSSLSDSTTSARDRILDFEQGTDLIDLSGLGFTGIQSGAGSGTVLGYVYSGATDRTYVSDDGTFSFFLDGNYTLTGSDFDFS